MRHSNSRIHAVVRLLASFCLAYMDVGEGREQDAEALSCARLSHFQLATGNIVPA